MKYQHVIFDWDGTLGKTLHLWLAGYRIGLQNQQHTFPDSVIARDFFYEHDKASEMYPDIDIDELLNDAKGHVLDNLGSLELYDNVISTLDSLKDAGVTVSLVSSSYRPLLEAGLDAHNLQSNFVSILGGDDVSKHKPNPMAFQQTLDNVSMKPEETIIIGDAKTDVLAGKAAGVSTCLFTPADNEMFYDFAVLRATDPDYIIDDMGDFAGIVLGNG